MDRAKQRALANAQAAAALLAPGGILDVDDCNESFKVATMAAMASGAVATMLQRDRPEPTFVRAPHEFTPAELAKRREPFATRSRNWGDKDFKRRFRTSRDAFAETLGRLSDKLVVSDDGAKSHRGGCKGHEACPLEPAIVLAAGLRFAAGGAYQDIADAYDIGVSTVYSCFWKVIMAINATKSSDGIITDCCGAVDGWLPRIQKPPLKRTARKKAKNKRGVQKRKRPGGRHPGKGVENTSIFWSGYKHYDSVNVQVIAGAERRFLHVAVNQPGSQPDSVAYDRTALKSRLLARGGLGGHRRIPHRCFLGDDAFKADDECLTPWPGKDLERAQDNFNHLQSRCRMPVECSIGRLVGLWGIFWRPLRIHHNRIGEVIGALMKLSNLMLDHPGDGADAYFVPVYGAHTRKPSAQTFQDYPMDDKGNFSIPSNPPLSRAEQKANTSRLRVQLTSDCEGAYHRPGCT